MPRTDQEPADANASRPERAGPGSGRLRAGILFAFVIAAGAIPRILFLGGWRTNFDSDEALVGVQALEILRGHFGLFLPGQSYMGSLQSLLAAPMVALFGAGAVPVRLSPLLWVIPGFLALRALERLGEPPAGRGRHAGLLALSWAFPPAVLFLSGVKARGGNLEGLVLGLWAAVLLWPRRGGGDPDRRTPRSSIVRAACGGLLLGLAAWTHDQALILVPLAVLLIAFGRTNRLSSGAAFAAGLLAGYLPLWAPRLAPFAFGPPGTEGTEWTGSLRALADPHSLGRAVQMIPAALTTGFHVPGIARIGQVLFVIASVLASAAAIAAWLRPRSDGNARVRPGRLLVRRIAACPSLAVTGWLALATGGALLLSAGYFEDPQWFRYTLGLAPFLVVAQARGLALLPGRKAWAAAGLLCILSASACLHAVPGWDYPWSALRPPLAAELERTGRNRIQTDWQLAYPLMLFSRERLLCASSTPPRFPEINATVDFSPETWTVGSVPVNRSTSVRARDTLPPELSGAFRAHPRALTPPDEVVRAFRSLDPSRTLFATFEPFPLLESYRRDWRGWPYRRPLDRFDAIVVEPGEGPAPAGQIAARLDLLVREGRFALAAEWEGRKILVRNPRPR